MIQCFLCGFVSVAGLEWSSPWRCNVCVAGVLGKTSGLGSLRQRVYVHSSLFFPAFLCFEDMKGKSLHLPLLIGQTLLVIWKAADWIV